MRSMNGGGVAAVRQPAFCAGTKLLADSSALARTVYQLSPQN